MKRELTLKNKTGLHARPAALFVYEASKYKSDIKVEKDGRQVNAKSILGVLTLGAPMGSSIIITAEGEDEKEAIDGIAALVEKGFGEE